MSTSTIAKSIIDGPEDNSSIQSQGHLFTKGLFFFPLLLLYIYIYTVEV